MKKQLFFIAAAALGLASCSQDETIEVNTSEAISFRTFVNAQTRADDIDNGKLTQFNVTARYESNNYFDDVTFTKGENETFNSATNYYWPANALNFYAYSPIGNTQVTRTDYRTFTVKPSDNTADQVDLVYANTNDKTKATSGANGVVLNFRHTGSKIVFQVKNTAANMKFEVTGWKVGYLDNEGTFTYADANTDEKNATQLAYTDWSENTTYSAENTYTNTLTAAKSVAASTSDAALLDGEMILIPQKPTKATAYAAATADSKVNGSYVALEIKIMNNDNAGTVIQEKTWAIWPVAFSWEPGKKYTYTIDLAGGGYYEKNIADSDEKLDPILKDAVIKFVNVTVDEWQDVTPATDVTMPGN